MALQQTYFVRAALLQAFPGLDVEVKEILTRGDTTLNVSLPSLGGKGLFTAELEEELLAESIDIAVHSLKDLPTEEDPRFELGAIMQRVASRDVLVSKDNLQLADLAPGSVIGTSSPRRETQLRRLRPDLQFKDIRGNVDTRIRKVHLGEYAATVLAEAGLTRIGLLSEAAQFFTPAEILPAPGQGALAVQCAAHRADVREILSRLNSSTTRLETVAERAFLKTLSAGCSTPIGALATVQGEKLALQTRCLALDGGRCIELAGECRLGADSLVQAFGLGADLATQALAKGFRELD